MHQHHRRSSNRIFLWAPCRRITLVRMTFKTRKDLSINIFLVDTTKKHYEYPRHNLQYSNYSYIVNTSALQYNKVFYLYLLHETHFLSNYTFSLPLCRLLCNESLRTVWQSIYILVSGIDDLWGSLWKLYFCNFQYIWTTSFTFFSLNFCIDWTNFLCLLMRIENENEFIKFFYFS